MSSAGNKNIHADSPLGTESENHQDAFQDAPASPANHPESVIAQQIGVSLGDALNGLSRQGDQTASLLHRHTGGNGLLAHGDGQTSEGSAERHFTTNAQLAESNARLLEVCSIPHRAATGLDGAGYPHRPLLGRTPGECLTYIKEWSSFVVCGDGRVPR